MATALLYTSDERNSAYDRAMLDLDTMYVEFIVIAKRNFRNKKS